MLNSNDLIEGDSKGVPSSDEIATCKNGLCMLHLQIARHSSSWKKGAAINVVLSSSGWPPPGIVFLCFIGHSNQEKKPIGKINNNKYKWDSIFPLVNATSNTREGQTGGPAPPPT